ncbi:baseplate hub [Haloarcula tailed virus 2]|uniref:Baseplate hub n=1 Tax=Haloarcula tailed virus 2 TaxID=2877989 RepID=A0AAE8XZA4_9CAUD|nr:baseplate hub [Haloarcula tailed virus 2]UBF23176.1 baseplate hub [Haloarcula tailed virus 2]
MVNTPDTWSKDCDNKRVKVEVYTNDPDLEDITNPATGESISQPEWVEIPTTKVELAINEDGQADINRYARVDFPTEWDGVSVIQFIDGYNPKDASITYCRIWFKNDNDNYVLQHFGFAGGVGTTSDLGVSKMWIYDLNELMKAVPASFTFMHPTPMEVMNAVTEEINNISGIMLNPTIIPPNTQDEVKELIRQAFTGQTTNPKQAELLPYSILADNELTEEESDELQENFETSIVATTGIDFDIDIRNLEFDVRLNEKVFAPNRDTLIDVMNWLATKMSAKWHIEPFPNGGRIVMDVFPDSRSFVQEDVIVDFADGVFENSEFSSTINAYTDDQGRLPVHNSVDVIANSALADIRPHVSVIVRGETSSSISDRLLTTVGGVGRAALGQSALDAVENRLIPQYNLIPDARQPSKQFPEATATVAPFAERIDSIGNARAATLRPPLIESDSRTIEGVERDAREALLERASEAGEGEIEMFGEPHLMPYDRILTYPTCGGLVPAVGVPPIAYRVTEVRHVATAGDVYRSKAQVSLFIGREDIEIESEMIDIENGE